MSSETESELGYLLTRVAAVNLRELRLKTIPG